MFDLPISLHTIDFLIFVIGGAIGLTLNLRRWKEITVFLQVALLIFKMARYFMNNHPHGKKIKKETKFDEKLGKIYKDKLFKYDKKAKTIDHKRNIIIPEY